MRTLESLNFWPLVRDAVARKGCGVAAVLDFEGNVLAMKGERDSEETRAITAVIAICTSDQHVLTRLLNGESIESAFDKRVISVGLAARRAFVVVVCRQLSHSVAETFRRRVENMVGKEESDFGKAPPPNSGSGGSSSGPAEVQVVEWGITARRRPS